MNILTTLQKIKEAWPLIGHAENFSILFLSNHVMILLNLQHFHAGYFWIMDWVHALTKWEKMKCSKKTSKMRFVNKELNRNTLSVHQYQHILFFNFYFKIYFFRYIILAYVLTLYLLLTWCLHHFYVLMKNIRHSYIFI